MSQLGVFAIFCLILGACTDGPCHTIKHPELIQQQQVASLDPPPAAGADKAPDVALPPGHILVAKPDGSTQCGRPNGIALDVMEKDLGSIKVYSRQNRSDSKMHALMCGSPTGKMNVYEIQVESLKKAEEQGFKFLPPN